MKQLVALVAFMMWIPVPVLGQGGPGVFLEPEALTAAPQDDAGILRSRIVTIKFERLDAVAGTVGGWLDLERLAPQRVVGFESSQPAEPVTLVAIIDTSQFADQATLDVRVWSAAQLSALERNAPCMVI